MIHASCHCGETNISIDANPPDYLLSCNCSLCKRYGTLWSYYSKDKFKIESNAGLDKYSWGEKQNLAFVRCKACGCITHWEGLLGAKVDRVGVNSRLFTNLDFTTIRVRPFDGAETWKFLDE